MEETTNHIALSPSLRRRPSRDELGSEDPNFEHAIVDATTRLTRVALAFGLGASLVSLLVAALNAAGGSTYLLGAMWVVAWVVAVGIPRAVAATLGGRWWWLVVTAVCGAAFASILLTGGFDSYLKTEANWLAWVVTVVLSARLVLLAATALSASLLAAFLVSGISLSETLTGPDRYIAITDLANPFVIAVAALALTGVFRTLFNHVPAELAKMRAEWSIDRWRLASNDSSAPIALLDGLLADVANANSCSPRLTPAEAAIVDWLAAGLTPQQIALESHRSEHTIYDHIANAKRKFGANTTSHLIALAWQPTS